jgi:hypothetical protein
MITRCGGIGAVFVLGALWLAACPIGGLRDNIGAVCDADVAGCLLDHVCVPDDPSDPGRGLCAPILDQGRCAPPTYPQQLGTERTGDFTITDADGFLRLELDKVNDLTGQLRLAGSASDRPALLGELCPLRALQRVGGRLVVTRTDVESLDGLYGLGAVGAGIAIVDNNNLTDVLALRNLAFVPHLEGTDISVLLANNNNLTDDAVDALREHLQGSNISVFACGARLTPAVCPSSLNPLLVQIVSGT